MNEWPRTGSVMVFGFKGEKCSKLNQEGNVIKTQKINSLNRNTKQTQLIECHDLK